MEEACETEERHHRRELVQEEEGRDVRERLVPDREDVLVREFGHCGKEGQQLYVIARHGGGREPFGREGD